MDNRVYLRYDKLSKVVTTLTVAFLPIIFIWTAIHTLSYIGSGKMPDWLVYLIAFSLLSSLAIVIYFAAIAPRYYVLDEEGLFLKQHLGSKRFSRTDYEIDTDIPASEATKGALRVWGAAGYCGYLGLFLVEGQRLCLFYLTRRDGKVIRLRHRGSGRYTYISQ